MRSFRPLKGFSAIETTIVVVIVGLLTALILPQLPRAIENQRVKAAEKTLYEIYCSQKRYFLDNGGQYATALAQLDTIVNVPSGFSIVVANNASQLATFAKTNGNYSLIINSSGNISCSGPSCSGIALNTSAGGTTQPGGGTCQGGNNGGTEVGGTTGSETSDEEGDGPVNDEPPLPDDGSNPPANPVQEAYDQVLGMIDSDPEALAQWIEENPDMWQTLLEQYPELEEMISDGQDPSNPNELEDLFKEIMRMLEDDPKGAAAWIEENPDMWQELLEQYPELEKMIQNDQEPLTPDELADLYKEIMRMFEDDPRGAEAWIEENPDMWQTLLEQYPDLSKYYSGK